MLELSDKNWNLQLSFIEMNLGEAELLKFTIKWRRFDIISQSTFQYEGQGCYQTLHIWHREHAVVYQLCHHIVLHFFFFYVVQYLENVKAIELNSAIMLRGPGGSSYGRSWKLILYCFLIDESEIYQLLFTSSKNIDPDQSYRTIAGKRLALMCNSIACANFNRDFPTFSSTSK